VFRQAISLPPFEVGSTGSAIQGYVAHLNETSVGMSEVPLDTPLSVYPNPTNDHFRVVLPNPSANWVHVFDQQGRLVHEERSTGQLVDIDVSGIRPGSYIVRSGTAVGQLVVQ
jgi:hypothetical protein